MNMMERQRARAATQAPGPGEPGPRIYNLLPTLVGTVSDWSAELPRIARMGFDWVYVDQFHDSETLSPPRTRQHFRPGDEDDAQIRRFVDDAASHGIQVMTDLVIDPTADVDHLDYGAALLSGAEAHDDRSRQWQHHIAHLQDLGITGFRCEMAYRTPPQIWSNLIHIAKERDPSCRFIAETLGRSMDDTKATAAAGFDFLFNSFAWWDLRAPWALEQYEALRTIAPTIAFPENHHMDRLAARTGDDPDHTVRVLKARYAVAALFSTGILMPMGYEWGYRNPLHRQGVSPADQEMTNIDISNFITAINRLRTELPPANREGAQWFISSPGSAVTALLRYDSGHVTSAAHAMIVLVNPTGSEQIVEPSTIIGRSGGVFERFHDVTPDVSPLRFVPGSSVILAPQEVRILSARRALITKNRRRPRQPTGEGRVIIENVQPEIDGGRSPVKRVVGDVLEVSADIFTDGHDKFNADLLYRLCGETEWHRASMKFVDNDRWAGRFPLERNARYQYTVEGWRDPFATWLNEVEKKRAAGVNVRLETIEGLHIVEKAAGLAQEPDASALVDLIKRLKSFEDGSEAQLELLLDKHNRDLVDRNAEHENVSRYGAILEVIVDRLAARFSAWYEIFPRSQSGNPSIHGTFDDVIAQLPRVKDMGFDVLYFTPIHPIGRTNRKGRNNSLTPQAGDPGSVYAIGSKEGGHKSLHPELGSLDDFRRLVAAAHDYGLEIALDFAIQCSPDHPWIKEHPEWFDWRPDGTIRFAENPPKKYEDIVNVHFYADSLPSLWYELRDVVLFWVDQGVRIFRVDNPHTKPIPFWEWMIAEVNSRHPDVLFLAEAFTRPKMMKKLAKIGFQQSYTYFTWRNTKQELIEYMTELAHTSMGEYYRPNFFANTPDINPYYLQTSGRPGFIVRGTLAATLSSVYGIYNGFELCEGAPVAGKEEYLDSEKYELKAWDYDRPGNITDHIRRLNQIRRENPALWDFRNITFPSAWNDQILAYTRMTPEKDNCVFVLVNLDPRNRQECTYEVPLWEFGLPDQAAIEVEDLLSGGRFTLHGKSHRIALDPAERSVVIWRLIPPSRGSG
jgi:starch synthase (maltosyl-transferring)